MVTLCCAAGAVLHLFTTGQGNIIGNPIVPVIKITANPKTAATMSEHIDLDVSGTIRLDETLDQAGDRLIDMIADETVAEDSEKLMAFLAGKGHPALTMDPMF